MSPARTSVLVAALGASVLASLALVVAPRPGLAQTADPAALTSFGQVVRVLQSPRCVNCHPAGDAPLQGDHARPHRMNVSRRSEAAGMACSTCHQLHNAPFAHGPPGAPNWHLPPAETPMVFQGRSPHDICETLKDPARNGHKSLPELREHFASDPLVGWGWDPGPGRTLPPLGRPELVAHVDRWLAAGAPCPP